VDKSENWKSIVKTVSSQRSQSASNTESAPRVDRWAQSEQGWTKSEQRSTAATTVFQHHGKAEDAAQKRSARKNPNEWASSENSGLAAALQKGPGKRHMASQEKLTDRRVNAVDKAEGQLKNTLASNLHSAADWVRSTKLYSGSGAVADSRRPSDDISLKSMSSTAYSAASTVGSAVGSSRAYSAASWAGSSAYNAASEGTTRAYNAASSAGSSAYNAASEGTTRAYSAASWLASSVSGLASSAYSAASGAASSAYSAGSEAASSVYNAPIVSSQDTKRMDKTERTDTNNMAEEIKPGIEKLREQNSDATWHDDSVTMAQTTASVAKATGLVAGAAGLITGGSTAVVGLAAKGTEVVAHAAAAGAAHEARDAWAKGMNEKAEGANMFLSNGAGAKRAENHAIMKDELLNTGTSAVGLSASAALLGKTGESLTKVGGRTITKGEVNTAASVGFGKTMSSIFGSGGESKAARADLANNMSHLAVHQAPRKVAPKHTEKE
jgi:hypothetical protein